MLLCADTAMAANPFEQLLMPGPVARAHEKIEQDCQACHVPFEKKAQDRLCLDCHKPVAGDMAAGQGFHGKTPLMASIPCSDCHDDHKGRDFDMTGLNRSSFPHDYTDFALRGAHRTVACADCHQEGKRWAEAPQRCFACHKADDQHAGNLGQECQSCHKTSAWKDLQPFDHGKTRFPLKDKHAAVACIACHVGEVYKGIGTDCASCHAIDDVHRTRFGADCKSCHNEKAWSPAKFDHGKHTPFPLKGAHATAQCSACHGDELLRPLATACFDCHKAQDVHHGSLGSDCASCHNETGWRTKIRFDHDLTRFPLSGLHAAVACEACHVSQSYKDAKTDCASCHKADDVHLGRFTARCESCHTASGWTRVSFDHGRDTTFKLTGKHATAACYSCHAAKNVADASLPKDCFSCHAKQDVHRGKFGTNCASCHSTTAFSPAVIRP